LIILLLFVVVVVLGVANLQRRDARNKPIKQWVRSQPVTFSTRGLVRQRATGLNGCGWGTYKSPCGAQLLVRTGGIEVSLAPPFDRLMSTGSFLAAQETEMWIDRVGWGGSAVGATECIRLSGRDRNGDVQLAIRPTCPVEVAWQALIEAGARPSPGSA